MIFVISNNKTIIANSISDGSFFHRCCSSKKILLAIKNFSVACTVANIQNSYSHPSIHYLF